MLGTPCVAFEDVMVRFGRAEPVLHAVSFRIEPGSFHFVTGASGSGKTTLLKLVWLAERPSRGRVSLFGEDVSDLEPEDRVRLRRRLGVVLQEHHLLDHLSVFDNAAIAPRVTGRLAREYRPEVVELLAWVGLSEKMDAAPASLSAGEKQRLALARAVINRPDLLIADEPTGNLDNAGALRILRLFTELHKVGTTVLIASHDEDFVARSGMPRLHISEGRLTRFEGRPRAAAS
ncbi:MAG: cell division ATP-binding protein FtsE [Caulobacteraceae bacterium]